MSQREVTGLHHIMKTYLKHSQKTSKVGFSFSFITKVF